MAEGFHIARPPTGTDSTDSPATALSAHKKLKHPGWEFGPSLHVWTVGGVGVHCGLVGCCRCSAHASRPCVRLGIARVRKGGKLSVTDAGEDVHEDSAGRASRRQQPSPPRTEDRRSCSERLTGSGNKVERKNMRHLNGVWDRQPQSRQMSPVHERSTSLLLCFA